MPDLDFQVEGVEPRRFAAEPALLFKLQVKEVTNAAAPATPIHSILLRCQVRIEPARRRYTPAEQEHLLELFGTPDRWGQTLLPFTWTQISAVVPAFTESGTAELIVPCSFDFSLAATKYFAALEGGELPLCFLFSGTIFYEAGDGSLNITQIPWHKESSYRLPAKTWQNLMDQHYPNTAWLCLRRDAFDSLRQYKSHEGHATWEQSIEQLLLSARGVATP
jgi:hypothetical protein